MPTFDVGVPGLTGTIGLTVYNEDGTVYAARSTTGITELGSGTYWHQDPNPSISLHLVWDTGVGTTTASETLFANRAVDPLPAFGGLQRKYDGPWQRAGLLIGAFETTVLPKSGGGYQAWHSNSNDTWYATAPTFFGPWTDTGAVVTGHKRSCVTLVGSTYHMYCSATGDSQIDYYTSTNGTTWTQQATNVIPLGSGSAWDATAIASTFLVQFGSTWYLYYEAYGPGRPYNTGVATASSPAGPWTKYSGNPVLGTTTQQASRPCVKQVGADLYMWFHGHANPVGGLPTDVFRAHSLDMLNWTIDASPLLVRSTEDEGANRPCGQMADVRIYEVDNQLVLTYTACKNGSGSTVDGVPANSSVGTKYAITPIPRTGTARIWNGTSWS